MKMGIVVSKMMKKFCDLPNLNHYKYKFLNYLNTSQDVEITILAGSGRENSW